MSAQSKIEWTDSTFNPWIGCTKVSPACDHCYAEAQMDTRMGRVKWGAGQPRSRTLEAYWQQAVRWNERPFVQCRDCRWRGELRACPLVNMSMRLAGDYSEDRCPVCADRVALARRRVFCASLADWLDNEAPVEWLADLLSLIHATPNLDWLLLSKRVGNFASRVRAVISLPVESSISESLRGWLNEWLDASPPANVWLGATICSQVEADRDIPKLLSVPAANRFLSIEPMLGHVDIQTAINRMPWQIGGGDAELHWIICGGESGPHARPMHPDWVRSLRDQCAAAGVPFLFKQWGAWAPSIGGMWHYPLHGMPQFQPRAAGRDTFDFGDAFGAVFIGKHAAGRLLDGVEHNGVPA